MRFNSGIAAAMVATCVFAGNALATTTLQAGDMLFTGWSSNSGFAGYTAATFVDIEPGTEIYFTDMSWKGDYTTGANGWNVSNSVEGLFRWTTNSTIAAGTNFQVVLNTSVPSSARYVEMGVYDDVKIDASISCYTSACAVSSRSSSLGTLESLGGTSTSFTFPNSTDTFYIFQGGLTTGYTLAVQPILVPDLGGWPFVGGNFIAAASDHGPSADAITSGDWSYSNNHVTIHIDNIFEMDDGTGGSTYKYASYAGPRNGLTFDQYKAAILDKSNWITTGGNATNLGLDTTNFQPVPEPRSYLMQVGGLVLLGGLSLRARRQTVALRYARPSA